MSEEAALGYEIMKLRGTIERIYSHEEETATKTTNALREISGFLDLLVLELHMANKLKRAELLGSKSLANEIYPEFGTLDDIIADRISTLKIDMDKLKDIKKRIKGI